MKNYEVTLHEINTVCEILDEDYGYARRALRGQLNLKAPSLRLIKMEDVLRRYRKRERELIESLMKEFE